MPKKRRTMSKAPRRSWLLILALITASLGAVAFAYREPISGYGNAGTAYMARVGCSCRFIAGRDMADCEKDAIEGAELIFVSENEGERSVTARMPLVASTSATYREGYGCVLERWES